jgi:hypothetical protein
MVSLKYSDPDEPGTENQYGWGTEIRLNDDQCQALGISQPIPVGTKLIVTAMAFVCEARSSMEKDDADGGKADISMSLQLTEMELSQPSKGEDMANKLYPRSSS